MHTYTDEQLVAILKALQFRLGRTPTLADVNRAEDAPAGGTFARRFGTWNAALQAAGLRENRRRQYSQKDLAKLLKERAKELGRTPRRRDMRPSQSSPSSQTYAKHFGSWNGALRAAGLSVTQEETYSRPDLISYLHVLAKEVGRTPTVEDVRKARRSIAPYQRVFGSWPDALKACGFESPTGIHGGLWRTWQRFCERAASELYGRIGRQNAPGIIGRYPDIYVPSHNLIIDSMVSAYISRHKKRQVREYTKTGYKLEFWCLFPGKKMPSPKLRYVYSEEIELRLNQAGAAELAKQCREIRESQVDDEDYLYTNEELIERLKDLTTELGRHPTQRDMQNHEHFPSAMTYAKRFGSWNESLIRAGIPVGTISEYRREELLVCLKKLAKKLKRTPTINDLRLDPKCPSQGPFVREFGSWTKALEQAGLKGKHIPKYSTEQLLAAIAKLARELGRVATSLEMNAAKGYPSSSVFKRAFGSYNAAVLLAGLKPARQRSYTSEELVGLLQLLAQKLGRRPRQHDMNAERGFPGATVYIKRFGSWTKALERAGLN